MFICLVIPYTTDKRQSHHCKQQQICDMIPYILLIYCSSIVFTIADMGGMDLDSTTKRLVGMLDLLSFIELMIDALAECLPRT